MSHFLPHLDAVAPSVARHFRAPPASLLSSGRRLSLRTFVLLVVVRAGIVAPRRRDPKLSPDGALTLLGLRCAPGALGNCFRPAEGRRQVMIVTVTACKSVGMG